MNGTLDSICTEYFNTKKLLEEARKAKELAKAQEKDKPIVIGILVFLVAYMITFISYGVICKPYDKQKSKQVGPISRTPIIPFSQKKSKLFKGNKEIKNVIPEARILCTHDLVSANNTWIRANRIVKDLFSLRCKKEDDEFTKKSKRCPVPRDAETISIKMERFEHGALCHEFSPIEGMAPGSYFTYQMFGDNRVQVTRYVEDGVSYVAGFCIYLRDSQFSLSWLWGAYFPRGVIGDCVQSEVYPGRKEKKTEELDEEGKTPKKETAPDTVEVIQDVVEGEWQSDDVEETQWMFGQEPVEEEDVADLTVKYCPAKQRIVITKVENSGAVIHKEWDPISSTMESRECQECTEQKDQEEENQEDNDDEPPPYSSIILV